MALADIQQSPGVRGLSETQWNRHFINESIRGMRADPARVLRLATVKLRRMWNPFPNVDAYQSVIVRLISSFWSGIVFSFAVAGTIILTKRRGLEGWRTALFLALPALCLTLLHCFFVGSIRYRLPAMPMIEIMASLALVGVGNWFLSDQRRAD